MTKLNRQRIFESLEEAIEWLPLCPPKDSLEKDVGSVKLSWHASNWKPKSSSGGKPHEVEPPKDAKPQEKDKEPQNKEREEDQPLKGSKARVLTHRPPANPQARATGTTKTTN